MKLAEQCTPSPKGVSRIREEEGESASITRKGARLEGKVKVTELLITSVTKNKPKMLIGLSQKGKWSDKPFSDWFTGTFNHRNIDRT